jgi:hypothetical protein
MFYFACVGIECRGCDASLSRQPAQFPPNPVDRFVVRRAATPNIRAESAFPSAM